MFLTLQGFDGFSNVVSGRRQSHRVVTQQTPGRAQLGGQVRAVVRGSLLAITLTISPSVILNVNTYLIVYSTQVKLVQ